MSSDSHLVTIKNTRLGKDSKGRDVLRLSITIEEAEKIVAALESVAQSAEKIMIDVHTEERVSEKGNKFPSSFMVVRPPAERPKEGSGSRGGFRSRTKSNKDFASDQADRVRLRK